VGTVDRELHRKCESQALGVTQKKVFYPSEKRQGSYSSEGELFPCREKIKFDAWTSISCTELNRI